MEMANPLKLFHLTFEITALVVYHIPRWLVSGTQIWLYEDRKGNWTFGRHLRVRMKNHVPGLCGRYVQLELRFTSGKFNSPFTGSDFPPHRFRTTPLSKVQTGFGFRLFQRTP